VSIKLPVSVATERLPPDPGGTADFMSRIGYSLEEALSDIIDNSIDAHATVVLVRFVRGKNRVRQIIIADNGDGMLPNELHNAMQYGVRQSHEKHDLGKYGIGLKAAAFSQCRSLSVMSRKSDEVAGRRWTAESIKNDWRLERLDASQVQRVLSVDWRPAEITISGTIVVLDQLDSLQSSFSDFEKMLQKTILGLKNGFGLRFHRFLEREKLKIVIDATGAIDGVSATKIPVEPLDPFGYGKSGKAGYPVTFALDIGGQVVDADAHIWPPKSKDANYKLGNGKVAERQGFYFYRNDRLIKAGGWHQFQGDAEPHLSLARVLIEMPPSLDSQFRLTVQKNDFNVPPEFVDAVRASRAGNTTFNDYLKAAQDTYRNAPQAQEIVYYVGKGVPAQLSRKMERLIVATENVVARAIDFEWGVLDEGEVFDFDADKQAIVLNSTYRRRITGGRNSAADAPAFKTLLLNAIGDLLDAGRVTVKLRRRIERVNSMLLEAVKYQS